MEGNLTLLGIVQISQEIEKELVEQEGELSPSLEALTKEISERLEEKADAYVRVMDRLSHSAAFYAEEARRFQRVADGLKKAQERVKETVKSAMHSLNVNEIEGKVMRLKLVRQGNSLQIEDEKLIPPEFQVVKVEPKKKELLEALKEGREIPGVKLTPVISLRTYVNRKD